MTNNRPGRGDKIEEAGTAAEVEEVVDIGVEGGIRLLMGVEFFESSGHRIVVWKKDEGDFLNN